MEIKFSHTPDDSDLNAMTGILAKENNKEIVVSLVLLLLVLGMLFALPSDTSGFPSLFIIVGALGMHLYSVLTFKSRLSKRFKSLPGFNDSNSYRISADGVEVDSSCCRQTLYWSHFQSFIELRGHFILMKGRHPSLRIPKRLLPESEQESLRQLLREKLPAPEHR
jgi:hypothetical protein